MRTGRRGCRNLEDHGLGPHTQAPQPPGLPAPVIGRDRPHITDHTTAPLETPDYQQLRSLPNTQHGATCVGVLSSMSIQTFLKASRIFRQAGALPQALHVYNGMRRMGVPHPLSPDHNSASTPLQRCAATEYCPRTCRSAGVVQGVMCHLQATRRATPSSVR